jgi:hypothetical protein
MSLTNKAGAAIADTMEKPLVRVGEAAELLSVSRWTKIGKGSLRIFRQSIVDLIQRNESDAFSAFSSARYS